MNKIFIVTVAIMMILFVTAKCERDCIHWNEKIRVCSSKLSDMVREVCQGKYYDPSDPETSPISHEKRLKRHVGIVHECCYNACTPLYLRSSYCEDSRTFKIGDDPRPCIQIPTI